MNTDDLKKMSLAGTVSVPPKRPRVAEITFETHSKGVMSTPTILVCATMKSSNRVTVKRSFFLDDVTAVHRQDSDEQLDGDEVRSLAEDRIDKDAIKGVVYVREHAQSLLEVSAGLTAAESVEYYPPLPDDRSRNHYSMGDLFALRAGDCDDPDEPEPC